MSAQDPLRALLTKHRRQVERSPGIGVERQSYALALLDDLENDLDALPAPLALGSRDTVHIVDQPAYGPTRWGPGWFYPDAPVAREDGGENDYPPGGFAGFNEAGLKYQGRVPREFPAPSPSDSTSETRRALDELARGDYEAECKARRNRGEDAG